MKFLKEEDDMEGIKHDDGKPRMSLLSSMWLEGVTNVLNFGAKKYAAHNWRKGIARSRLLDAAFRHINAYNGGEDFDSESGLLHLYHASCCLMFASELHFTHPDLDDRYNRQILGKYVPPIKPTPEPTKGHLVGGSSGEPKAMKPFFKSHGEKEEEKSETKDCQRCGGTGYWVSLANGGKLICKECGGTGIE